jgi:small subunit ribosomal protein S6e
MAKFKIVLSDPETGQSQIVELEGPRAVPLVGRKLGETMDGAALGFGGYKVKITGGSDKDGFPMRPDIHGGVKTRVVMAQGVGFHPTSKGQRRRKTVRGSVITEEAVQINMKIVEKPKRTEKEKQQRKAEPDAEEEKNTETTEGEKPKKRSKAASKEAEEQVKKPEGTETGG